MTPPLKVQWFHFTRALGAIAFLNELLLDTASDARATIMLAACGLMGYDSVARKEKKGKEDGATD